MIGSTDFILLSPEYERRFESLYNRKPEYIPVDLISNNRVPHQVDNPRDMSRTWIQNPEFKGVRHKRGR